MNLKTTLIIALSGFCAIAFTQNTSQLWGENGELWDSTGRLPDFSHAGYHAGEAPIPNVSVVTNVKDFGAVGDGVTNNYQAFKDAIAATDSGAILIPKGRYVVNGLLNLNKSNIVLRGEGSEENGTVLYFPKTLTSVFGGTTTNPWLYGVGGLLWVGPTSGSIIGTKIADININTVRGSKILNVSNASGISVGQYIVLKMNDPTDHSLLYHLHNDLVDESDYPSFPSNGLLWPVKVTAVNENQIELEKYLRFDVRTEWGAAIFHYTPKIQEVGVENLRIETPDQEYPGHHVDYGYNGLTFRCALNCWATNIAIKNTESGIDINASKNCELRGVKIYGGSKVADTQDAEGTFGHHGISFSSNAVDNVLTDFYIYDKYIHDITIQSMSNGNVIKRGIGHDINFDFHKYSPFENLFSNVNVGLGNRVYLSSGGSFGPHSAARETFWNLKSTMWNKPYAPEWGYIQTNVIPADSDSLTAEREWYEMIDDIEPKELYGSQFLRRTGDSIEAPSVMTPMIHPKSGIYGGDIKISIFSLDPSDEVRYTTDGTEPDSTSSTYTAPFTFNASDQDSLIVMAKIFKDNIGVSSLASSVYLKDTDAPVILDYRFMESNVIRLSFNEAIDTASALNLNHYYIEHKTGEMIADSAKMTKVDEVTLYLSDSFIDGVRYTFYVIDIKDIGGNIPEIDPIIKFTYSKIFYRVSGFQEGNPPEHLFDKNFDTRWSIDGFSEWLLYDFGQAEQVYGVKLAFYNGNKRSALFSLNLSLDGDQWTQVFDGQSSGQTTKLETFSFDTTDARFLKIICKGNNEDNIYTQPWNSYTELEILYVDTSTTPVEPTLSTIGSLAGKVKVYPNPVTGNHIIIEIPDISDVTRVDIIDITGRKIYSKSVTNKERKVSILINDMEKGIYIVSVTDGKRIGKEKLIIR